MDRVNFYVHSFTLKRLLSKYSFLLCESELECCKSYSIKGFATLNHDSLNQYHLKIETFSVTFNKIMYVILV